MQRRANRLDEIKKKLLEEPKPPQTENKRVLKQISKAKPAPPAKIISSTIVDYENKISHNFPKVNVSKKIGFA